MAPAMQIHMAMWTANSHPELLQQAPGCHFSFSQSSSMGQRDHGTGEMPTYPLFLPRSKLC